MNLKSINPKINLRPISDCNFSKQNLIQSPVCYCFNSLSLFLFYSHFRQSRCIRWIGCRNSCLNFLIHFSSILFCYFFFIHFSPIHIFIGYQRILQLCYFNGFVENISIYLFEQKKTINRKIFAIAFSIYNNVHTAHCICVCKNIIYYYFRCFILIFDSMQKSLNIV